MIEGRSPRDHGHPPDQEADDFAVRKQPQIKVEVKGSTNDMPLLSHEQIVVLTVLVVAGRRYGQNLTISATRYDEDRHDPE